ncbi:MAG: response regulator, partial [Pirellulales bacterium]
DMPANQKLVSIVLARRGHRVEIAQDGREALDLVQREPFDVVLMDVQMPTLDGWQTTAAIRRLPDPAIAQIPIVAMTAHATVQDQQRCMEAGMDGYVAKPFDIFELTRIVEMCAACSQSQRGLAAVDVLRE